MKRIVCIVGVILLVSAAVISAIEVDREELETVEPGAVEFLNYEGPHGVINTRNEIIGIGRALAAQSALQDGTGRYHSKYSVIHAVGPEGEQGMPADIFILESGAGVDHIRNLRRIVAGYLSTAYSYDFDRAMLIAEFVTIYNAVFRRDMEMVAAKYSATVIGHLEPDKMGISTRYDEWAGNTMMLIPLTGGADKTGPGAVSSEEVSSDEVIEKLREEEDRGIDQRKGMVELREEEAEGELDRIAEERRSLEDEEAGLTEKEKELEEDLERARDEGTGDEEELEKELEETRERLADTEERKEELEEEEKEQEERVERIRDEREQIAEDEKDLLEEPSAPAEGASDGTLFILYKETGGRVEGTLVVVSPATGAVKKQAGDITVMGKGFSEYRGSALVVGKASRGFVTILSVGMENLDIRKEGAEEVHPDSQIVVTPGGIYAAVISGGGVYLGRFDEDLVLADRSADPIIPYSYIKADGSTVMVQSEHGDVLVLDSESLEEAD